MFQSSCEREERASWEIFHFYIPNSAISRPQLSVNMIQTKYWRSEWRTFGKAMTSEKLYMLLCERAERASWELFAFLHSKHCRLPQSQFLIGKRDIEYGRFERQTSGRVLNQREEYNGILRPSLKILHSKHCRLSQSRYKLYSVSGIRIMDVLNNVPPAKH